MTTQVRGIAAQYAGKCEYCGERYEVGDLIDKLASGKRGHALCAANEKSGRPPQSSAHPTGQTQTTSQPQAVNGHANGTNGHAAATAIAVPPEAIAALWRLKNAFTEIASGAMKAAVTVDELARQMDPHQVHAPRQETT